MNSRYVKTLLYAYPSLKNKIKRIDELVIKCALGARCNYSDCISQCEKIVELTTQKAILIEIRHYMNMVLKRLSKEQLIYVEYKYVKRKPKEFYKTLDLSSRTYFRKQQKILEHIGDCFSWMGKGDSWFEGRCLKLSCFKRLLLSVINGEQLSIKNPKAKYKLKKELVA